MKGMAVAEHKGIRFHFTGRLAVGTLVLAWVASLFGGFVVRTPENSEASVRKICGQIAALSREKGFTGMLGEMDEWTGPEKETSKENVLADWNPLINSEVSRVFSGTTSSDRQRRIVLGTLDRALKERDWVSAPPDLKRHLPDYYLFGTWGWEIPSRVMRLTLRVVRADGTAVYAESSGLVTHPRHVWRMTIVRLALRYFFWLIGGGLLALAFWRSRGVAVPVFQRFWQTHYVNLLLKRLESHYQNGHYAAAGLLVVRALSRWGEDDRLLAFRDRLMNFCGGNLQKSQAAYVEAIKLRQVREKLESIGLDGAPPRSFGEKERWEDLLPYHPDLKLEYAAYVHRLSISE